jgi:hypothetical protein
MPRINTKEQETAMTAMTHDSILSEDDEDEGDLEEVLNNEGAEGAIFVIVIE